MVLEVGRVCVKTAGRDAGKKCVIVNKEDNGFFLVDGQTRRRSVKQVHLEPLNKMAEIKEGASNSDVVKALQTLEIECTEKKEKQVKEKKERPKKQKKKKSAEKPEKKTTKKTQTKKSSKTENKETVEEKTSESKTEEETKGDEK